MFSKSNKEVLRTLVKRKLSSSRNRNIIIVLSVALTCLLFTSVFTTLLSVGKAVEEANFKKSGSSAHATFKGLTKEQLDKLIRDDLIVEYGVRRNLGIVKGDKFIKNHIELAYSDKNNAKYMFNLPVFGDMPKENTNEAILDLEVLNLLGLSKELGQEFSLNFEMDGRRLTETFILSGYFPKDEAVFANNIIVSKSMAEKICDKRAKLDSKFEENNWDLYVMFNNSYSIKDKLLKILEKNGFQNTDETLENYIDIGLNPSYIANSFLSESSIGLVVALIVLLFIIIFTGYLIIYNVFQIGVIGDVKYYALLKSIGVTNKQFKIMLKYEALILSTFGILLGLISGFIISDKLTPYILSTLNGVDKDTISMSPYIFILSAFFSIFTVLISLRKPNKILRKISVVEGIKFTSDKSVKKLNKKNNRNLSVLSMAKSNLGRNKRKTVLTMLSLSFAVLLFTLTMVFVNGFSMDKYLDRYLFNDYVVADAHYFRFDQNFIIKNELSANDIDNIKKNSFIKDSGVIYGERGAVKEVISKTNYEQIMSEYDSKYIDGNLEKIDDGYMDIPTVLYGMDRFFIDKIKVIDGDITQIFDENEKNIVAVYFSDDNGRPYEYSNWAKVGDVVKLKYEEYELSYNVVARVIIPYSISYRFRMSGVNEFIVSSEEFTKQSSSKNVILYSYDIDKNRSAESERFISDYTRKINPKLDYESKITYAKSFEKFKNMFLIVGIVLSVIIGIIGILNFINTIITGVLERKLELAMLNSIGMTNKQIKNMLIVEGLMYSLISSFIGVFVGILFSIIFANTLEDIIWVYEYKFTIAPLVYTAPVFLIIGVLVPLLTYLSVSRMTVTERLRDIVR